MALVYANLSVKANEVDSKATMLDHAYYIDVKVNIFLQISAQNYYKCNFVFMCVVCWGHWTFSILFRLS